MKGESRLARLLQNYHGEAACKGGSPNYTRSAAKTIRRRQFILIHIHSIKNVLS